MSTSNLATIGKPKASLAAKFAERFSVDEKEVFNILKSTAFKQRDGKPPSDEQMTALMIVADQYGLNPFVKEIYAYPDKSNGIVPVVGVDGWSRIMNEHPQMDGIEFRYSEETTQHKKKTAHVWIEAIITRKDRSKPIVVREYFDEVVREANFATPWDSHPKRMHRHKAEIQCARIAFGFAGIYDEDEAERIAEKDITDQVSRVDTPAEQAQVSYLDDATFNTLTQNFKPKVEAGAKTPENFISWVEAKGSLMTDKQKTEVLGWVKKAEPQTIDGQSTQAIDDFVSQMDEEDSKGQAE